jgi:hypothetical protein
MISRLQGIPKAARWRAIERHGSCRAFFLDDQEPASTKKENNPFSREEKHGDQAHRRAPEIEQEYQGGPPDDRRAPGVEEDAGTEEPDKRKRA